MPWTVHISEAASGLLEAVLIGLLLQALKNHAALNHHGPIDGIDFLDLIESFQGNRHIIGGRDRALDQPGQTTLSDDRLTTRMTDFESITDLLGVPRSNDGLGPDGI